MIRRIVIVDRDDDPAAPGQVRFRIVLRLDVPAALRDRYAGQRERLMPDTTPEEEDGLRAGTLAEQLEPFVVAAGITWDQIRDSQAVRSQVEAALITRHGAAQLALNALVPHRLFRRFWDGTSWST